MTLSLSLAPVGILLLSSLAAGCLGDFKTPSAYMSQTYYCQTSRAAAFQALAQPCVNGGSCTGAFSMQGTMQGQPLTVGGTLSQSVVALVQTDPSAPQFWDRIIMNGASPYFDFVFHAKSVGGDVSVDDTPRMLTLQAGAGGLATTLADDLADVGQTLQVGGASTEEQGLTNSGSVTFTKLTTAEIDGVFHGSFGDTSDIVDGCFIMYPNQVVINPSPSP